MRIFNWLSGKKKLRDVDSRELKNLENKCKDSAGRINILAVNTYGRRVKELAENYDVSYHQQRVGELYRLAGGGR